MEYNYNGKLWRQSGTVSDTNSFFHSAFGVRADEGDLYFDKLAHYRRMCWATFLTYFKSEAMSPSLEETLKRCLSASIKYKSIWNKTKNFNKSYVSKIRKAKRHVAIEEIPIVATLENIRIILFVNGARDPITIANSDLILLSNYPTKNEFKGEVVMSLEGNVFSRLDPIEEDSVSKFPDIEGVKEGAKQLTAGLIKYKKGGNAGSEGVQFQVGLLTIFFLNALEKLRDWKLSTENKEAGKFDDVVLECPEGDTLLQAKHKQSKMKKVTFEDLISTNSKNDDFSLPKYFLSYEEIKGTFKLKSVIICTNANIDGKTMKFLKAHKVPPESMLYYQNCDCKFYTFTDEIVPHLRENAKSYFKKNWQSKGMDASVITDENIKEFLERLQFYSSYPPGNDIEKIINQMLSHMKLSGNIYGQASFLEIHTKILDWFQQKDGVHLTELYAKAIFAEIRRDRHWQRLEKFNVFFQNNGLTFQTSKQMFHITVEGRHLLQEIQIFRALEHSKSKILFVNPDDGTEVQKWVIEAFQLPQYVILVLVWPQITNDSLVEVTSRKLQQILYRYQHKKIVLVAAYNNKIPRHIELNTDNYEIVNKPVKFEDFTQDTRRRLLKKESITFQGNDISLEQLLPIQAVEDYDKFINSEILEMLLRNEKIEVGGALSGLSDDISPIYMKRKLKVAVKNTKGESEETTESEVLFSEDEIYDLKEKVVLISDGAGMGKSTLLTSLTDTIKQNHPHLWVVRIDLNNYTEILKQFLQKNRKRITVTELLNSKISTKLMNHLEISTFSMDGKVVLIFDGFDEISPDYSQLILNLLLECREAPNFAKIFITTRPHVSRELEMKLQGTSLIFEPFTRQNQIDFFVDYWMYNLHLTNSKRDKCEQYAKTLIDKVFYWLNLHHETGRDFTGVPLQVRMFAEIFQENDQSEEAPQWQGCKEFLSSYEAEPKLPDKMDITRLYQMFIEKKRKIFIDRGNFMGNTAANHSLINEFEECLAYQRSLSLELILGRERCRMFSCYRQGYGNVAVNTLKIGIVQKLDDEIQFIHRTFAEYFVAQSLLQEIQTKNRNLEFQSFFIEIFLLRYEFIVVRAFLDGFLKLTFDDLLCRIFETDESVSYKIDFFYEIRFFRTLAEEGNVFIFRLILKCVKPGFVNISNEDLARLQQEGLDLVIMDETLLETAARNNRLEMVTYLVEQKANVNLGRYKPHHLAVEGGHFEVLKFLVEHGADITSKSTPHNKSLLYKAVIQSNTAITAYLLDITLADQNPDDSLVLYTASSLGRLGIVNTLLKKGVNIDSKVDYGETPLFGAARGAQFDTIRYLVQKGCDMNARNYWKESVLEIVPRNSLGLATAKFLIELGADINSVSSTSNTALHSATKFNSFDMIKLFVTSGANVNSQDVEGDTALHQAADRFRWDVVEFLISNGANVDLKNNEGNAPLHIAVSAGFIFGNRYAKNTTQSRLDSIKILVKNGEIDIKNSWGYTALHLAVLFSPLEFIRLLVELGADINMQDHNGKTALHLAASLGQLEVTQLLVKLGADIHMRDHNGKTALHLGVLPCHLGVSRLDVNNKLKAAPHLAASSVARFVSELEANINIKDRNKMTILDLSGKLEVISFLVELGMDINMKDHDGVTALHLAASSGQLEVTSLLVELGADINMKDHNGRTALHLAASSGQLKVTRSLVKLGADINMEDHNGITALYLATLSCHLEVSRLLVELGADVNNKLKAALHLAVLSGKLEVISFLVELGVDINMKDHDGVTALHLAALSGQLEVSRLLIKSGANINIKEYKGKTVLHLAVLSGHLEVTRLFLKLGIDINIKDYNGVTALHLAALYGQLDISCLLVEWKADINMKSHNGMTALCLAAFNEHRDIVELLVQQNALINPLDWIRKMGGRFLICCANLLCGP